MVALVLSVVLAAAAVAAFPCWRHSARWGYAPCISAATLLMLVAVITVGGRPPVSEALVKPTAVPVRISAEEVRMANLPAEEPLQAF